MSYTVIRPADHAGWLAERAKGIGSSEVGTIFGVNSFDTPFSLWQKKTGRKEPDPENDILKAGHMLEPGVAQWFSDVTGAIIDPDSVTDWIAVDDEHPWRRVSPDRMYWPKGTPKEQQTLENATMLECKTTSHVIDKDNLPNYWFCQIQYQMGVLGLKQCCIAWISWAGGRISFDWTEVKFLPAFFNTLMKAVDKFWLENIVQDIEPEKVTNLEDAAAKWNQPVIGSKFQADADLAALVDEYVARKKELERLDAECKGVALRIQTAMGNNELLVDAADNILLTWKQQNGRESFDSKAFKAEYGDEVYARFLKPGKPFRVFKPREVKSA